MFELRRVTSVEYEIRWLGVRSSVYAAAGLIAVETPALRDLEDSADQAERND